MELPLFILTMLAIGAGVGIISSALGVGGGLLMVPILAHLYPEIGINTIKGSSLIIIIAVAMYNTLRMNRGSMKNPFSLIAAIALGSLIGGFIGGKLTTLLSDEVSKWLFIFLVFLSALRTFFLKENVVHESEVVKNNPKSFGIGALAGGIAGATGTGGGALFVPLSLWSGIVSNKRAVALSNAIMITSASAAALAHILAPPSYEAPWTYGQANISFAPGIILGAILFSPVGRHINHHLSFKRRRVVMGILLLLITLRMLLR
jgi:uncharacterized protein